MKIRVQEITLLFTETGRPQIVLTTNEPRWQVQREVAELKQIVGKGKELAVEVKQYRQKRSLNANALLWKMCGEIANIIRSSKDEVYLQMLERYGVFTHIIVKKEAVERIKEEWRTVRVIGEVTINGQTGIQLQCYYGSHLYNSKEFSVLLDGVLSDAKELGIEVITEEEKSMLLEEWGKTA